MGKLKNFGKKIERETKRLGDQVADAADSARKDAERIARSAKFDDLREKVATAIAALEKQATDINTLTQIIESAYPGSTSQEVEKLRSTNEEAKTLFIKAREQEALVRNSNNSSETIENAATMVQETMTEQMQALLRQAQTLKQAIDSISSVPIPDQAARIAILEEKIAQLQLLQQPKQHVAESDMQTSPVVMASNRKSPNDPEDDGFEHVDADTFNGYQKPLSPKPTFLPS